MADGAKMQVYIGTYTHALPHVQGKGEGTYLGRFDPESGALVVVGLAAEAISPSFLAVHPSGRYLYTVGEVGGPDGHPHGVVVAFARDPRTGALQRLNQQSSHGDWPCHLSVDRSGRLVMAANYLSGSVAALPIRADGSLGEATVAIQHHGSSVDPVRQAGPHAHSITPDLENRFALVADLGLDRLLVYRIDPAGGRLTPNDPPSVVLAPGAGPRHVALHPSGRHVYVINELGCTVTAFGWVGMEGAWGNRGPTEFSHPTSIDAARGALAEVQTVSTLPDGFDGRNTTADIHVHPSGRFLYGSNRGHDSIVAYAIDPATGRLDHLMHASTGGRKPRNFAIDPSGRFLLAANQDSDSIVTFRIDEGAGTLAPTGHVADVPTPVCVRFAAASS